MDAKFSGTIVFVSAFYNRTGLAVSARAWAKALHGAGINVRIVSVNDTQPGIDDCSLDFIKSLEQTPITPPVTAIFFHNPSESWLNVELPVPYLRIMMTGFIGENVPADWVDVCNRMDQLCIQSKNEKNAWVTSGTNPHLVQVLPCLHPWQFLPIVPLDSLTRHAANREFRFLSLGTFSPNRRWDALIEAYLEEFKGNDQVELYLRVNYPKWHPVPGQPQYDLSHLINMLRAKTQSAAKIIIDDALGTRLDIMRLMDSCDVYVSTDVSVAAPVAEAIFRRKLIVAAEVYNSGDTFFLPPDSAIFISGDNAEKIVVQGEMLPYLPQYKGVSWLKLEVKAIRQALRDAYHLSPDDRLKMVKTADNHLQAGRDRLVPLMVKIIKNAWAYKQQTIALNDTDLQSKLSLINQYRQQQRAPEALPLIIQVLKLAPRHIDVLALCGLVSLDLDDLPGAENVWRQLPWYSSLTHPDVMALLEGLLQKNSQVMTPQHLIELAKSAKLEGAWTQAIKLFKIAIAQSLPDKSIAFLWRDLADCYHQLDDEVTAQEMLEKAYSLSPNNIDILCTFAKFYLHQEQYSKASLLIDQGLSQSPNSIDFLILKGNSNIKQNNFDHAFDIFQQVSVIAPQTLALAVTMEELAAITGKKAMPIKTNTDQRPQIKADSIYTRHIMADVIAKCGFEIGEFTYGTPVIRWWGEDAKLKVGRFCSIAANVKIYLGGNHRPQCVTSYPFPSPPMNKDWPNTSNRGFPTLPATKGDVLIGNDVWIGDDTTILSGVTVSDGAVIAARSVVSKDVPPYAIIGGNPARIISKRFSEEEIAMLLELKWWDWNDAKINEFVPYLCSENVSVFYNAVKESMATGARFSKRYEKQELFTGERAMPLAPNMEQQVMREHWARYNLVAPMVKGKRVLDIACGAGYGSNLLAETAQTVTGGDISHETVAYCRANYSQKLNLQFGVMDIRKLPFADNSFDFVVSFETLEHIAEGDQFLREICRVLSENGVLAVSTPFGGPCGNRYHVAYYQRGSFGKYLLASFKEIDLKFQRGDQFYASSISPDYAPTFTGEYGLAICRKPKTDSQVLTSIITLTHNQLEYTKKFIESIFTHTKEPFELIVVDNGSTDGTVEYLETEFEGQRSEDEGRKSEIGEQRAEVRIIKNKENLGFAAGNNQGMAAARGNYILLMNNDIVVTPGWLERMISCAEKNPRIGIVGPMSNYVSGPQLVENVTYDIQTLNGLEDFATKFSDQHGEQSQRFLRVVGFCMLIKRAVINRIGGMDASYGLGNFEDDDFSLRATLASFESWIAKDCFIHHFGSRTFIGAKIDYRESLSRNWEIFKGKWGFPKEMPYGSYNATEILKKGFIPEKHYYPLSGKPTSNIQKETEQVQDDASIQTQVVFKKEMEPGMVSIIIPVSRTSNYLKKCVSGINAHTPIPHEIIFVDNGCKGTTLKWIRQAIKRKANYSLSKVGKEAGLSECFNVGMEASSGEYIVLLRDQVIVSSAWCDGMLGFLNSSDSTGIIGPMTNNKIAGKQSVGDSHHVRVDQLEKFAGSFRERNRHRRVPSREIMGFCMLFRRSLVEQIGSFDEDLEQGSGSDDYCLRAALEGYNNLIAGDVFVLCGTLPPKGNKRFFNYKWRDIDARSHDGEKLGVLNAITNAERLYQREEIDKAIVTLIDGIKYSPDEAAIYYRLAEMLIDCERFKEGLDAIDSMPEDKEQNVRTLELTGYCKAGLDLYDEAAQCADLALSLNDSSASVLNLMGVLAHGRGDISASEDFFKRAISSDPGYGEAYTNLGVLEWGAGRKEDAFEILEKGFILSPTTEDNRTAYLSAVSETAEFERAECVFREAKALYPENRRIAFLLIDILIRQEKYDLAMQNIREALITFGINDNILSAAQAVLDRFDAQKPKDVEKKPALSLCMIVKNEEHCLARCLMSAIPVADEIIIVDTGSTDRTKAIAKTFGAKVYDFEWTDDFSEARNLSLSVATGDWILVLDADETISPLDYDHLTKIVKKKAGHPAAYSITTRNYVKPPYVIGWTCNNGEYPDEEEGTGWYASWKVRLFPNDKRIHFENPVHELLEASLKRNGIAIIKSDIPVHHYGQLDRENYVAKGDAYYQLGKKKLEEKGEDLKALTELAIQAGGEFGKYEEAVDLWKRVLKIDPRNTKALVNMGGALLRLHEYEAARTSSKMALTLAPDLKEAAIIYTTSEVLIGDAGKTIPILEDLLKKVPEYPLALAILAVTYCIEGEREKGLENIKRLTKMGFETARYLHDLSKMLISTGKTDSAVSLLEFAVGCGKGTREIRELLDGLLTG